MATEEDAKSTQTAPVDHEVENEINNASKDIVESKPDQQNDDDDDDDVNYKEGKNNTDPPISSINERKGRVGGEDDDDAHEESSEKVAEGGDDLEEEERKALAELRSRLEVAIKGNKLLKEEELRQDKKKKSEEENKDDEKQQQESSSDPPPCRLWGVALLPSKGEKGTDVVLLKFLRARELEIKDALDMLRDTLRWRKDNNVDAILDEDFGNDFTGASFMEGHDREGRPVCYNVLGVLAADEMYNKTLAAEEMRKRFLRWRVQLMEKGIQQLEFRPGHPSAILQVNDLKHTPGPNRNGVRLATKQAVALFQDNYPEFAAKNIFINVPFWYYAFAAIFSPFTQRTKSKFVYARSSRVTDTLLKCISVEQIPIQYGGLKRENDSDFSIEDEATEVTVKPGSTESIEISAPQVGTLLIWDLTVVGWDVSYKEEFVPEEESSYTVIVQRERKIVMQDDGQVVRNSFTNKEPGKLMLILQNSSFKKKRIFYRYKIRTPA